MQPWLHWAPCGSQDLITVQQRNPAELYLAAKAAAVYGGKKKPQGTVKRDKEATCVEGFAAGPSALGTEMVRVAFSPAPPRSVTAHIKAWLPPPTAIRDSRTLPRSCLSPWRTGLFFCSDKEVTSELQQSLGSSLNNCVLSCLLIISPTRLIIPHVQPKLAHQLSLSKGLNLILVFDGDRSSQSLP